jgi:hypothetical protein
MFACIRFLFPAILAPLLSAQVITGSLEGVVRDPQGGLMAGAEVWVVQAETGYERRTRTNDSGVFRVEQLNVGSYGVDISAPGFKRFRMDASVGLGGMTYVNATMQLGEVAESVTVEASVAAVDVSTSEVSRNYGAAQMAQLPVLSRNPADLLQLAPGVPALTQDKNGSFTVGGLRPRSTSYNVDGSSNNFEVSSGFRTPVILEAVQETRALTNVYSSQFGKGAGAVVDMVLKSGTNRYHGELFAFHRNAVLDATPFFNNARGVSKPPFIHNTFGATFGGPVVRNRTFFFAAIERIAQRSSTIIVADIPSNGARQPDLAHPLTLATDPVVAELIRSSFARLPSCEAPGSLCRYSVNQKQPGDQWSGNLKVDHQFDSNNLLSIRFLARDLLYAPAEIIRDTAQTTLNRDTNLAITWRRVISPRIVNELIFANSYFNRSVTVPATALPDVSLPGLTIGASANLPQGFENTYYQFVENFSIAAGNHFLRLGADALHTGTAGFAEFDGRGIYAFAPMPANLGTPDGWLNFRLGRSARFVQSRGDFARDFRGWDSSFYLQDDWKLRPNLTVNLGLRYEIQFPRGITTQKEGKAVYDAFDFETKEYTFWRTDLNNLSPFAGVAWDPTGKGSTSLRAGYRLSYDRIVEDFFNIGAIKQEPYVKSYAAVIPAIPVIPLGYGESVAKGAGTPVRQLLSPGVVLPRTHSWQFSLQRRLFAATTIEAGYLGTAARKLPLVNAANRFNPVLRARPDPSFEQVETVDSLAWSNYHGLTTLLTHRPRRGLFLTAAYTWSKALDLIHDAVATYGGAPATAPVAIDPSTQRPYLGLEYGPAVFDRRHVFSSSFGCQMPRLTRHKLGGVLVNGWMLSGILLVQIGNPFTVMAGADLNQDGLANDRPDLVNSSLLGNLVFDRPETPVPREAFGGALQPIRIGSFGRNVLRRDAIANIDFQISKTFPVTEGRQLQFRAEMFNAANHPRFGTPNNTLSNPSFGAILSQENSPRYIRLGLKFLF